MHNLQHAPFVLSMKIILPPLHIKLGICKNFVKDLPKDGETIEFLKNIKEGIFNGPDIRKIMKNEAFTVTLNPLQKRGWRNICNVVFLVSLVCHIILFD